jgi:TolA-binding protein
MRSTRLIAAVMLLLVLASTVSSCRSSRTSRNARTSKAAPTVKTNVTTGPSAASVMAKTDSVISRIGEMNNESELPPMAFEPGLGGPPRSPWGTPYVPRPSNEDYDVFEAALGAFNGGDYDQAIGLLSQVVVSGRPSEMIPNAYYWIGESYYALGRYAEMLPYFEHTVKVGPQHKREMAMYKLARGNHAMGNEQAASTWYQRLRAEYPKTTYASRLRGLGIS